MPNKKTKIQTPYGEAYLYIYDRLLIQGKIVSSGDSVDYMQYAHTASVPTHKFKQLQN